MPGCFNLLLSMKRVIVILFLVLSGSNLFSQEEEVVVPYTLADRERLVRVEVRLDGIERQMDGLDKRMDRMEDSMQEIRNAIYNLFYSMIGLIGVFVAVLVWDRRKTLYPVMRQMESEKDRLDEQIEHSKKVDKFLKELAQKDKKIQEAMKHAGLL